MVWRVPSREIGAAPGQPRITSGLGPRRYPGQQYEDSGTAFFDQFICKMFTHKCF